MREAVKKARVWYEEYQRAATPEEREAILKKFRTYLMAHPEDLATRYAYITLLMSEERVEEALQQLDECLSYNPTVECIILKAKILNSIGRSREACEFIEQVKEYLVGSERLELEVTELLALINSGNYEKALSVLQEIGEERMMEYMAKNPARDQNVIDILNELEAYEKGKKWAKENEEIFTQAIESVKKFFEILSVVPKIEGDWEIADRPVIHVTVLAPFNTGEEIQQFLDKERKAVESFYEKFPSTSVRLFIEPVEVTSNVSAQ